MSEYEHITTEAAVKVYNTAKSIFEGLLSELKELSRKKPDTILSLGKVKIVNRVLSDLKSILENEPEGKYLDILDEQLLPQNSDAVLVMVQYKTALAAFHGRYGEVIDHKRYWITHEILKEWGEDE